MVKKHIFLSSVTAAVVVILASVFLSRYEVKLISKLDWSTYQNTVYNYSIRLPRSSIVSPVQEEERLPADESRQIVIFMPSRAGVVGITTWDPSKFKVLDEAGAALHNSITEHLDVFATAARAKELNDKNPNFPDKKVGELKEIVFAGAKAYSYSVTGYSDGFGGTSEMYVFLEKNGVKYLVYYSLDYPTPQQIASTFEFVNTSTSPPSAN